MSTTLDATAIGAVRDLAQEAQGAEARTMKIGDRVFSTTALHEIEPEKLFEPTTLVVRTLTGLVDYLKENRDGLEKGDLMIHVAGPGRVDLFSKLSGGRQQRFAYASAQALERMAGFHFGQFYPTEVMVISLQSLFEDRLDRAEVLRLLGNVKDEAVKTEKDDGITQTVEVRAGVATVDLAKVPNPVSLAPYRSFPEIEQPESSFIFRLTKGQHGIEAALFEGDGGAWRQLAIARIRSWLDQANLSGIAIIA